MLPPQSPAVEKVAALPPNWFCPKCHYGTIFDSGIVDAYFESAKIKCSRCGEMFEPWELVSGMLERTFMWEYFCLLGATTIFFKTRLFLNTETRLNLHDSGVPTDAYILNVQYSPTGFFCMEMTGNSRRQTNRGPHLQLFGFKTYTIADKCTVEECDVNITVTFIKAPRNDIALRNLVEAFDAFADDDYKNAIIPANVAVEGFLFGIVDSFLAGVVGKKNLESFYRDAGYSHQLNVLFPIIANSVGAKMIDDRIRGLMNRLRKIRNDLAHTGTSEEKIDKKSCGELLTATIFMLRYLKLLNLRLVASS